MVNVCSGSLSSTGARCGEATQSDDVCVSSSNCCPGTATVTADCRDWSSRRPFVCSFVCVPYQLREAVFVPDQVNDVSSPLNSQFAIYSQLHSQRRGHRGPLPCPLWNILIVNCVKTLKIQNLLLGNCPCSYSTTAETFQVCGTSSKQQIELIQCKVIILTRCCLIPRHGI